MSTMIELNYQLSEEDFLDLQLFYVSTDEEQIRKRKKDKYRLLGLFALCAAVMLLDGDFSLYTYFFLAGFGIFLIIYPWWSTWFYKRMYKRQISQQTEDTFPYPLHLQLEEDYFDITSPKGDTHIKALEITCIVETGNYFFIVTGKFASITSIPKNQLQNEDVIRERLSHYARIAGIEYSSQPDWKWK